MGRDDNVTFSSVGALRLLSTSTIERQPSRRVYPRTLSDIKRSVRNGVGGDSNRWAEPQARRHTT